MWGQFHRGDAHSISINLAAKLHTMHSPTCQNPGVARLEDLGAVAPGRLLRQEGEIASYRSAFSLVLTFHSPPSGPPLLAIYV
jgi:hypothetical protein